jgi:hypothetical protein
MVPGRSERPIMTASRSGSDSKGCITGLTSLLAALLLLGGALMSCISFVALVDRGLDNLRPNPYWAALGMVTALCQILNGLLATQFLIDRKRRFWIGALMLSGIGLVGSLVLCCVGYLWVGEVRSRGADPAQWDVLGAWLLGVIYPLGLLTLPLVLFVACLFILRPRGPETGRARQGPAKG